MDNSRRHLLRAWWEPQGQRGQPPEGSFQEEVEPWVWIVFQVKKGRQKA